MASSTHSVARQPAATSTELIWLGGRSDNNPRRSRPKTPARPRADTTACPETTSANDPPAPGHARQDRCARSGQHPQPRRSSARALPDRTLEPWGRPTCQDRAHECPTTRSARATNGAALRPQRAWSTSPADHSFRRMSGRLCVPCAVRKARRCLTSRSSINLRRFSSLRLPLGGGHGSRSARGRTSPVGCGSLSGSRRWREVVAGDDVVQPGCVAEYESVFGGEGGDALRVGWP
jgi:hypothetical protein